jgi:hypothetical protein
LNTSTRSKELLSIFILWLCPSFWFQWHMRLKCREELKVWTAKSRRPFRTLNDGILISFPSSNSQTTSLSSHLLEAESETVTMDPGQLQYSQSVHRDNALRYSLSCAYMLPVTFYQLSAYGAWPNDQSVQRKLVIYKRSRECFSCYYALYSRTLWFSLPEPVLPLRS